MSSLANPTSADDNLVLSPTDARELARLLRLLEGAQTDSPDRGPSELKRQARAVISERHRRARFFGRAMLGEPAWDMLLQLYVSDHGRLAIRDLVLMTEEPKTTALRWISYLEKKGLVERRPDPMDRRLIVIELLDRGRQLLDDYFKDSPRFADTI